MIKLEELYNFSIMTKGDGKTGTDDVKWLLAVPSLRRSNLEEILTFATIMQAS